MGDNAPVERSCGNRMGANAKGSTTVKGLCRKIVEEPVKEVEMEIKDAQMENGEKQTSPLGTDPPVVEPKSHDLPPLQGTLTIGWKYDYAHYGDQYDCAYSQLGGARTRVLLSSRHDE
jgi:hypothetical protein